MALPYTASALLTALSSNDLDGLHHGKVDDVSVEGGDVEAGALHNYCGRKISVT